VAEFRLKKGDRLPKLRMVLADSAGVALNLSLATVTFRMRLRGSATLATLTGAASVVDALTGVVEFAWGAGDSAAPGVFDAEWILTYAGGTQTVPTAGYVTVVIEPTA
jgi:hypothetical protein